MADIAVNELKVQDDKRSFFEFKYNVKIRGVEVKSNNIKDLIIRENIFGILPTLSLTFADYGVFTDVFPLGDEDDIEVQISTNRNKKGIKATFYLQDYIIVPNNPGSASSYIISLTGILKNNLVYYPCITKSYNKKKSSEVLKEIYTECKFEMGGDLSETSDSMTWLQSSSNAEMIKSLIDYSYKNDDNTIFSYVDKKSKAYIKDLTKVTKEKKKFTMKLSPRPDTFYKVELSKDQIESLAFSSYRFTFAPGTNNKEGGYGIGGGFYDYDKNSGSGLSIAPNIHPLSDYALKHKRRVSGNITEFEYFPMRYDAGNFHKNYHKAYLQNKYIRESFFTVQLVLNSYFNDEVKLLDKIDVEIPALGKSGNKKEEINKIYSGEYIVIGIKNQVNEGGSYKSILYLSRAGINKPTTVEKTEMKLNE